MNAINDISHIFKAYDVRGKVGSELTPDVANKIGKAFADWLPAPGKVAVGRDMRPDSGELAAALIEGLRTQGRDVIDIGEVTTDMIYFAVGGSNLAGGAVVTASHNPGEYNGVKFCREDAKPVGEASGLFDIRDHVVNGNFKPAAALPGNLEQQNIDNAWVDHVLSFIDVSKLTPIKIAVDAGNGMAGKIFPVLEPHVPWQVTEMYFELDGTFPNHEANPLKFETLHDLIEKIKTDKLDAGIAFDGDGDRAFLVDETGTIVPSNTLLAMVADYFLDKFPGSAITYDLRFSHAIPELIKQKGGIPVRTRVGHAFIKQVMREHDAPFGGEVSGHFYFRDNFYADSGLIAAVIGLYAAELSGRTLSQLREFYSKYLNIPEINFEVADKAAAIAKLKQTFADGKQDELDGITIEFADGSWFNVRPSNTESVLRLNAEAKTQQELDDLVAKVTSIIKS